MNLASPDSTLTLLRPALRPADRKVERSRHGFSLVEVVIALAIAATGFVTLLGLLPQGLAMSRSAASMAAKTRIVELMAGELASTPWSKISWTGHGNTASGGKRFFDDQGIEVKQQNITAGSFISYVVSVYVPQNQAGPSTVKLPVSSGVVSEKYMRRVQLYIASTSDENYSFPTLDLNNAAIPRNLDVQTIIIPEMGIP